MLPSLSIYYYAAMLAAVLQWWKDTGRSSWAVEQIDAPVPLKERAMTDPSLYFKSQNSSNMACNAVMKS